MKTLKITKTTNSTNGIQFTIKVDNIIMSEKQAVETLTDSDEFSRSWGNILARRGKDVQVYIQDYKKPISIGTDMSAKEAVNTISNLVVAILNAYDEKYPDTVETAEAVFFV